MLSCAHRLAAVTSFNARSLRFCCRWICTIRATASTVMLYQRQLRYDRLQLLLARELTVALMPPQQLQRLVRLARAREHRAP